MLWAQVTIVVFMTIKLLGRAAMHGKKTETEWSFPIGLVEFGIAAVLLWKAGALSRVF